jgi:hypothetical protein
MTGYQATRDFSAAAHIPSRLPVPDLLFRITNRKAPAARTLLFCLWPLRRLRHQPTKGT